VCSVAFLAHILTTGFQLSYGFLLLYAIKHLGQDVAMETSEWKAFLFLIHKTQINHFATGAGESSSAGFCQDFACFKEQQSLTCDIYDESLL